MLLTYLKRGRLTLGLMLLMIAGGVNKTVLLIENAIINGKVESIIGGKFSYVVTRVSELFLLLP